MSDSFFDKLYAEDRTPYAIDLVFDLVDDLLDGYSFQSMDEFMTKNGCAPVFGHTATNPNFEALNQILREVDLTKINSSVALSFLSAPFSARDHLTGWKTYRDRFRDHLIKTQSRKKAKAILGNFYK